MTVPVKFPEFEYSSTPCQMCWLMHVERSCKVPVLRALFVGPLAEHEDRFLRWMGSCDVDTMETFAALVQRAAAEERERVERSAM